jgi:hypothetical protein
MNFRITFRTAEDRDKVDLTRLGFIKGATDDGRTVRVEMNLNKFAEGYVVVSPPLAVGIIAATLAACGVEPESIVEVDSPA